ncbi:MAG: hypothetical protein WCG75_01540 [Armatimonadota bacterium]
MWNVPVRFVVMWAPIVAVSVGGGIYLYDFGQTVLSPGTGFMMDYPTKTGSLKITCKNYSIDLVQQIVVVDQLVIRKQDNTLLARVPHLVATGIAIDQGLAPKVQLKDAEVWVDRDSKGDLDILNLFEKSEGGASKQPWQVSIRDSVIHFTDHTVPDVAKNDIEVSTGNFVGLGDHVEGGSTVTIPGLIKGELTAKSHNGNTVLSGKSVTAKINPVLARLRAGYEKKWIEQIKPLMISDGSAVGSFSVEIKDTPILFASVILDASSVRWNTYQADKVNFNGTISEKGLVGTLKLQDKTTKGEIEGSMVYEYGKTKKPSIAGNVKVSGLSPAYLSTFKVTLPKEISFTTSNSQGYLTLQDGVFGWNGKSELTAASVYGVKIPQLKGEVKLFDNQLVATVKPTALGSTMIEGNFGLNLKSNAIYGSFSTPQLNAKDFSHWLPSNVLESKARLVGLIDGTLAKPNVLVKGSIDPKIKMANSTLALDPADVVLRYDGKSFQLDRLTMNDKAGSLYASGSIDLKKGLNVRVIGNNIDLAKLADKSSGKLDFQGQLTGKLTDPTYGGKMQGYRIGYTGIPGTIVAVATDFSGNQKGINFQQFDAMSGASQITGKLGIGFADQKMDGLFAVNGIEVSDLYEGPVGGVLDLKDVVLGGTYSKPIVNGTFEASKILAFNFAVDSAKGRISYDGEKFRISDASAKMSKGSITEISAELNAKTKTGKVESKFQKLDLSDVANTIRQTAKDSKNQDLENLLGELSIKGATSGSVEVSIKDGVWTGLKSNGRVDDVLVNNAIIGSGEWDASYDSKQWVSNAFIGSLAEYFRVDNALYNPTSGQIGGEFLSYQIPVKELILAATPSLRLTPEGASNLDKVNGKLASLARFSGTVKNPILEVPEFEISGINLGNDETGRTDLGTFSLKANYSDKVFTLSNGLLQGPKLSKITLPFSGNIKLPENLAIPDGTANLSGTIKAEEIFDWKNYSLNLSASMFGFPISKFSSIVPAFKDVDVKVTNANLQLKGTGEKPQLDGHVSMNAALTPQGTKVTNGIFAGRLSLDSDVSAKPIVSGESSSIQLETKGAFKFNELEGNVSSKIVLDSSFSIDDKAPFSISAKLNGERDVTAMVKKLPDLTIGQNGAKVSGGIEVGGTYANRILTGGFDLKLDSIKSTNFQPMIGKPIDLILKDLTASATFENDPKAGLVLRTRAAGTPNYSRLDPNEPDQGYFKYESRVDISGLTKPNVGNVDWMKSEILDGSLAFKNVGVYQSFAQKASGQGTILTESGKPIKISGTLMKPKFVGDIYFDDVVTTVPVLNATKDSSDSPTIEPEFDLRFFSNSPMSINSQLTSVNAKGVGFLKGTLSNLKSEGTLTVEKGSLTLPGGTIKLTPDGTIGFKYDSSIPINQAKLIADLHGETSLTALKNNVTPERYEISLDITGDILSADGLIITASSQPGDLSQDRILQLLGRTDLLQSLLKSGVNSNIENQLKDAVAEHVLPWVFHGITNDLAKNFKLDYLSVDYNAFEQASVSFAKSIGSGFFLQGRQQLFQPLPGQPTAYDFRLAYRPQRGPNSIRALSFSLGTDQLRPYKLSIDFTNRLRTRKASFKSFSWLDRTVKPIDPKQ